MNPLDIVNAMAAKPLAGLAAIMRQPFPEIAALQAAEARRTAAGQAIGAEGLAVAAVAREAIEDKLEGLSLQISGVGDRAEAAGARAEEAADGKPEHERTPLP